MSEPQHKGVIRASAAAELGSRLDDLQEAIGLQVHQYRGAHQALDQASKAVEGLLAHVDKDVDANTYDLEVAGQVKRYLVRAVQVVLSLAQQAANQALVEQGKQQAMTQAVRVAKQLHDRELAALDAELTGGDRPNGARPAGVKARRRAEEAGLEVVEGGAGGPPEKPAKAKKPATKRKPRAKAKGTKRGGSDT